MRFGISGDAVHYGLDSLFGQWFARCNLLRDFAALNKVEDVPFLIRLNRDHDWRLVSVSDDELTEDDYTLLDEIAGRALEPDGNLDEINTLYMSNSELQMPAIHLC